MSGTLPPNQMGSIGGVEVNASLDSHFRKNWLCSNRMRGSLRYHDQRRGNPAPRPNIPAQRAS